MKSTLIEAYSRLLTDLGKATREPLLEAHYVLSEEWVLKVAPKLDKAIQMAIEYVGTIPTTKLTSKDVFSLSNEGNGWLCLQDREIVEKFFSNEEFVDPNPPEMGEWLRTFIWRLTAVEYWYRHHPENLNSLEKEIEIRLVDNVKVAHQSLVFGYKAAYEPTQEQLDDAYRIFQENDANIEVWDMYFNVHSQAPLYRTARSYLSSVIYRARWLEVTPKHGPGAVWPSVLPCYKSDFKSYYASMDAVYSYSDYLVGLPNYWGSHLLAESKWQIHEDIVCRIQAVPKDSRGPRLICVHPVEAVWIQQGTRYALENAITQSPLTHGKINFHDQTVNGELALKASSSREFTTLDLKDASDRLSDQLVRYLFGEYAYKYIGCSRASKVQIGSRVLSLRKFAPMGNALTFPVQSLVFWAVVRAGISCRYGVICDDVYVFGDDIIYPSKYHDGAQSALVRCGLIPNPTKTFVKGSFRESCGVDAFRGVDVTPLRLKETDVNTVTKAVGITDLAYRCKVRGYHSLSAFLYNLVEKRWGRLSLTNNPKSAGLVRYEDLTWDKLLLLEKNLRFNPELHRWEVPTRLITATPMSIRKHEWFHVQDSLLRLHRFYNDETMSFTEFQKPLIKVNGILVGCWSERGLVYPDPRRIRLNRGWTEVLCK